MDIYEHIVNELFDKKSLAALIFLIDGGRELELTLDGTECFISRSHSSKYVSLWQGKEEQGFDSVYELLCAAVVNEKSFIKVWESAELSYLL